MNSKSAAKWFSIRYTNFFANLELNSTLSSYRLTKKDLWSFKNIIAYKQEKAKNLRYLHF